MSQDRPPSITSSASSPNLSSLEKRLAAIVPSLSITKSTDGLRSPSPTGGSPTVHVEEDDFSRLTLHPRDNDMIISASAPGSLQSSPRKSKEKEPAIPLSATAEVVDRPRYEKCSWNFLLRGAGK